MGDDYIPPHASVNEVCDWLTRNVGGRWTLSRLLESGLIPWFWLDYTAGWPEVFGDRFEGFLAPMIFAGDTQRLAVDGSALVTMSRLPEGRPFRVEPGVQVPIADLRFAREDVLALANSLSGPSGAVGREVDSQRPEQAQQKQEKAILVALRDLGFDPLRLPKPKKGRPGPKAHARKAIGTTALFQSAGVFEKAWERLRATGQLKDATSPT